MMPCSTLSLCWWHGGAGFAGADDEHHQWRRTCRQPDRHPRIHDHAGISHQHPRSDPDGRRSVHTLKAELSAAGLSISIGDEGGFAPNLSSSRVALDFILKSIEKAGYKPGEDIYLALDCAATEYYVDGKYEMKGEGKSLTSAENVAYLAALVADYPIISIEDGMSEDDWDGWVALTAELGDKIQLVGDDLFVTNPERIITGIEKKAANSLLVKVNQIGTLSETLKAVDMAHRAGMTCVMSHRSGETKTPPSPIWQSPPTVVKSKPARCHARTDWPNTTSLSASKKCWAKPLNTLVAQF